MSGNIIFSETGTGCAPKPRRRYCQDPRVTFGTHAQLMHLHAGRPAMDKAAHCPATELSVNLLESEIRIAEPLLTPKPPEAVADRPVFTEARRCGTMVQRGR